MSRRRCLLAITVYNGHQVVPRCLRSAARLRPDTCDLDVLVLDDASPAPGWSDEVSDLCQELGLRYYCSPRNLGIVRNVNLGLLRAVQRDYDFVIVANSDVLFPSNLVDALVQTADTDPSIGSVTAWSNNVSVYSLPNADPDANLSDQDVVDWVSAALAGEFGPAAIDVPAGISFCLLIPTEVIRRVGLMDPAFGRGYCEETDWSLRSKAAGYRITLGPSCFVYHRGRGSTLEAGMLAGGHTTVPANERIIDMRYPLFRSQVDGFAASSILPTLWANGTKRIITDAARAWGYSLHVSWLDRPPGDDIVRCIVRPDGTGPIIRAHFRGFAMTVPIGPVGVAESIRFALDGDPINVNVFDHGRLGSELAGAFAHSVVRDLHSYPERV